MVPHGTVENAINKAFDLDKEETPRVVVSAREDKAKGEALVVLTTVELDTGVLRSRLADAGIPNLWIPKIVKKIKTIPLLASGKYDLKALKQLASETDSSE